MLPLRCALCFSELTFTTYDCGIFVESCDCAAIEKDERLSLKLAEMAETRMAEICMDCPDRQEGYDEGLAVGFKNGREDHKQNKEAKCSTG